MECSICEGENSKDAVSCKACGASLLEPRPRDYPAPEPKITPRAGLDYPGSICLPTILICGGFGALLGAALDGHRGAKKGVLIGAKIGFLASCVALTTFALAVKIVERQDHKKGDSKGNPLYLYLCPSE